MDTKLGWHGRSLLALPTLVAVCAAAGPASLSGRDLTTALQRGGYVILMRHASSPTAPPDPAQADADNLHHERQLDEAGRASAREMGEAGRDRYRALGLDWERTAQALLEGAT